MWLLPNVITAWYSLLYVLDKGTFPLSFFPNCGTDNGPSSNNWPILFDIVAVVKSTRDGKAYNPCLCWPIYNVGLWKENVYPEET